MGAIPCGCIPRLQLGTIKDIFQTMTFRSKTKLFELCEQKLYIRHDQYWKTAYPKFMVA